MTSRIEQIIDDLEDYIEGCKSRVFNSNEIIVNKGEIEEYIRDLRMKTPEEIKRYQKIISNKEAILNDAREKAEKLINEATIHTNELISEHEIMQQAYAQAHEVVSLATKQAQEILDNAVLEANELRSQATDYTEGRLAEIENILIGSINNAGSNYQKLMNTLSEYRDIIQSNRQALYPVEALEDDITGTDEDSDLE